MASGSVKPLGYQIVAANHPQTSPILLLKDYLRDDLSSCSSSGFKSLPRRQCCLHPRSSSSTKSALQKASEAVLNAIKSLTIPSLQRSLPLSHPKKSTVLSRSLYNWRFLNRRIWRRASKGNHKLAAASAAASYGNSWRVLTAAETKGSVTTTNNTCSLTNSTKNWPNEEKEQFSPVSVLDCPLFDDDEEITSPFNSTCSRSEGSRHKHMQKRRHFKRVASLKPVSLEKRLSRSELQEDEPIYNLHTKPYPALSESIICTHNEHSSNVLRDNMEENARDLLSRFKRSITPNCLRTEAENLLLFDFFKQSIGDKIDIENSMKRQICKVAEDWIRGQPQEQYLSGLAGEGRLVYIEEMDKNGGWRNYDEETQHLAIELEAELSTRLVNELLFDLTTC